MGSIKWKQGIGYGTTGGSPHLVSTDGRFEIYKYEKTYNLRRYLVNRGYKLRDKQGQVEATFERLKHAKEFAEAAVEHPKHDVVALGDRTSKWLTKWTRVIKDL